MPTEVLLSVLFCVSREENVLLVRGSVFVVRCTVCTMSFIRYVSQKLNEILLHYVGVTTVVQCGGHKRWIVFVWAYVGESVS